MRSFVQMQINFGGDSYRCVFPLVVWHIGRVCDEAAGDLALQRGLLRTQTLVIHVIYKHEDIGYPLHPPTSAVFSMNSQLFFYTTWIITGII